MFWFLERKRKGFNVVGIERRCLWHYRGIGSIVGCFKGRKLGVDCDERVLYLQAFQKSEGKIHTFKQSVGSNREL